MSIQPKAVHTGKAGRPEIPTVFFTEMEQILLRCVWSHKGPRRAKETLRKENRPQASPSLTSHFIPKLQSPKQCGTGSKQAHRPEGLDGEPRTHPARWWGEGAIKLRQGGQGHTKRKGSPTVNGAGKTAHPITHAAPPHTSLTKNPALHTNVFLGRMKTDPRSRQSPPGSFSPLFLTVSSPVPPASPASSGNPAPNSVDAAPRCPEAETTASP